MSEFTHDLIVRKRKPGDPPANLEDGVVIWAALTEEDVKRYPAHGPVEIYEALRDAVENLDWGIVEEILGGMGDA